MTDLDMREFSAGLLRAVEFISVALQRQMAALRAYDDAGSVMAIELGERKLAEAELLAAHFRCELQQEGDPP